MHIVGQIRRYHRTLWGGLLALLIAGLLSMHLATAVSADVSVNIVNFKFDPAPLAIPVGTTVAAPATPAPIGPLPGFIRRLGDG